MKQLMRIGVLVCILISAGIHLYIADGPSAIWFYLNAVGYIFLGIAYANIGIHFPHDKIKIALQVYASLSILMWLFLGEHTLIAYIDKIAELLIVGLLWLEQRID